MTSKDCSKLKTKEESMNNVTLMGRLTDNIKVSTGSKDTRWTNFTLAVRDGVDEEGNSLAQFIRCSIFGKAADILEKFTEKGSPLCVRGHLRVSSYKDEDGKTVWSTQVIVEDFDLIGARKAEEEPEKKTNNKKYRR
jgi:single-strand DNA-binding protein